MDSTGNLSDQFTIQKNFTHLTLRFDGSCGPVNPNGNIGWGWVILDGKDIVAEGYGWQLYSGRAETSNNLAEWNGLYYGLLYLLESDVLYQDLTVIGDSMFVINILNGVWRPYPGRAYSPAAFAFLKDIKPHLSDVSYEWQSREFNEYCDLLASKWREMAG